MTTRPDGAHVNGAKEGGKRIAYCDDCRRIKGVGCTCGLSFKERIKHVAPQVPDHMRAVPRSR